MRHLKSLYVQVLIAILLGAVLGAVAPDTSAAMKPLGDGFIKLVRMLIAPSSSRPSCWALPASAN